MSKTTALIKWIWACPLRAAILMGGMTYILSAGASKWLRIFCALAMAVIGYFWQSALEHEAEVKKGKPGPPGS